MSKLFSKQFPAPAELILQSEVEENLLDVAIDNAIQTLTESDTFTSWRAATIIGARS